MSDQRDATWQRIEQGVLRESDEIQRRVEEELVGYRPAVVIHALAALYFDIATGKIMLHADFPTGTPVPSALPTLLTVKDALAAAFRNALAESAAPRH
jgi:hypothetical protein